MWADNYYIEETLKPWWQEDQILFAQNGAKLEEVETSEDPNVIPEGAMHKNLNHLDLDITKKGIPVITIEDGDKAETFEDVKASESTLLLQAEIESSEIIFSKELTDYVENARKEWHDSYKQNNELLLEVGKRITKEILTNTNDNTNLIELLDDNK